MSNTHTKDKSMIIEITNLTEPQRLAIEDMLRTWTYLGGIGSSRFTKFYADGDGNFQPKILVNGSRPELCDLLEVKDRWPDGSGGEYQIDFDTIAWRMGG
jgi:hypothetical protein